MRTLNASSGYPSNCFNFGLSSSRPIDAVTRLQILPPPVNRYGGRANAFGNHIDNAVRTIGATGERVRTDVSATLFLADPGDYDGGELTIEGAFGEQRVKLPAGDLVLYPASSAHRVEPVTRGARLAGCYHNLPRMWAEV